MRDVSDSLDAAIDSGEQILAARVSVDWDKDGYGGVGTIDDVSPDAAGVRVDRSLTTDLPDAVRVVSGEAAASLTVDLGHSDSADDQRDAAWRYSPYNAASPLYGKTQVSRPVTADIGYRTGGPAADADGIEYIRRFTGTTRGMTAGLSDGGAQLTGLDARDKLAGSVTMPVIDGGMSGGNATSLVSYALQASGVNVAPPIRDNCKLYVPMHGTTEPMIGGPTLLNFARMTDSASSVAGHVQEVSDALRPDFVPGKWVTALNARWRSGDHKQAIGAYIPDQSNGLDAFSQRNSAGVITAWVYGDSAFTTGGHGTATAPSARLASSFWVFSPTASFSTYLEFGVKSTGALYLAGSYGAFSLQATTSGTVPADGAWHLCAWVYDFRAPIGTNRLSMNPNLAGAGTWEDFSQLQSALDNIGALPSTDSWEAADTEGGAGNLVISVPLSDLQFSAVQGGVGTAAIKTAVGTGFGQSFTTTHRLDQSGLELDAYTKTDPQEAWSLITSIAEAERASVYFDEDGNFQYRALATAASTTAQTVQKTVTSTQHISELDVAQGIDRVKNVITASYTPVLTQRMIRVYSSTDTLYLKPKATTVLRIAFDKPVAYIGNWKAPNGIVTPFFWDNSAAWPGAGDSPWGMACARRNNVDHSTTAQASNILGMDYARIVDGGSGFVDIAVTNRYTTPVYIFNDGQTPAFAGNLTNMKFWGSPALMMFGISVADGTTGTVTYRDSYSIAKYGEQALTISSDMYQGTGPAWSAAASVCGDTADPAAAMTLTAVGDPRLQLGDRIRVQDPVGNRFDREMVIQGITEDYSGGKFTQQLTVREARRTLYWSPDSGHSPSQDTWDNYAWGS